MPDLNTEIDQLTEWSRLEIEKIHGAALLHQADLRKQIEWFREEQLANIEVRKIRLKRDVERLVRERSGGVVTAGPICRLPVELLSYIFRYYVALYMSPWRLVKVCKNWMETALITPHLWRYIYVKPTIGYSTHEKWVVNGEKRISIDRMQVCSTVVQLRAALRRSGAVPLEINVEIRGIEGPTPLNLSLMRMILDDSVSKRIEILNVATLPFLEVSGPPHFSIGKFYRLKKIHLPKHIEAWTHRLLESICSTSSQIESVRLDCEISPELVKYSFWTLIKALELNSSAQINSISEKLLNLEEFPVSLANWPDSATPVSTWAKIRKATILCHPGYLDRARLPNLQWLIFRDVRHSRGAADTMDIYSQLLYSNLTKLEVETPDIRWLSKLYSPSLTDLTISCGTYNPTDFPEGGTPIFNGHELPAVKTLKLTTGWADSALVETLASFSTLRTLKINPTQHKDQEFGLVLLKHLDGKDQPLICPNLARLFLGSRVYPVCTLKRNTGPLVKRLITSRKKTGKPFQELMVCWSKSGYTEERLCDGLYIKAFIGGGTGISKKRNEPSNTHVHRLSWRVREGVWLLKGQNPLLGPRLRQIHPPKEKVKFNYPTLRTVEYSYVEAVNQLGYRMALDCHRVLGNLFKRDREWYHAVLQVRRVYGLAFDEVVSHIGCICGK